MIKKRIIYFDCFSGISGDMILGAFANVGINFQEITNQLKSLDVKGYKLQLRHLKKNGINGSKVDIVINKSSQKDKTIRTFKVIKSIIQKSELPQSVKSNSIEIFRRLGNAEGKVHGTSIDKIHFHEVGAIDSIIDIVGGSLCMSLLNVDHVISSPINTGEGIIKSEHGNLPIPAPATMELLKGIPCYSKGTKKELTTPTGAAFIGHFAKKFGSLPDMNVISIGYGAGESEIKEMPNLLRIVVGETFNSFHDKSMKIIETNIDDMNPEFYDYVIDRLFKQGAVDVFFTPVHMKKNRIGFLLSVIVPYESFDEIVNIILSETTTFGIRYYDINRVIISRKRELVRTKFGNVYIKIGERSGMPLSVSPEYEECKKIASKKGIPIKTVYEEVLRAYKKKEG